MALRILFSFLVLFVSITVSVSAFGETADSPAPEVINIQNIEFEVSNTNGQWISLGSDESPEFLKSVSLKFSIKDGTSTPSAVSEKALRDAVKAAAEEKCRSEGTSDRPEELPATVALKATSDISSQQIFYVDQKFTGKYICAISLKP